MLRFQPADSVADLSGSPAPLVERLYSRQQARAWNDAAFERFAKVDVGWITDTLYSREAGHQVEVQVLH